MLVCCRAYCYTIDEWPGMACSLVVWVHEVACIKYAFSPPFLDCEAAGLDLAGLILERLHVNDMMSFGYLIPSGEAINHVTTYQPSYLYYSVII